MHDVHYEAIGINDKYYLTNNLADCVPDLIRYKPPAMPSRLSFTTEEASLAGDSSRITLP